MIENKGIQEIDNERTRAKLEGLQEAVTEFGRHVMKLTNDLEQKKGVVAASKMIASRLLAEMQPVQHELDAEKMTPEEAKIRIDQIQKLAKIVNDVAENNRADIGLIRGRIEGIGMAGDIMESRFNAEVSKHERWKRIEEEEAAERAEMDAEPEVKDPQKKRSPKKGK